MSVLSSPFAKKPNTVTQLMLWVVLATLPGVFALVFFFGVGVIVNLFIACSTALITESIILKLRQRPVAPILWDGSAFVTAWLLALALPPLLPWWMTVLGTSFAIVFAKHVYGGLGNNIFNPAMVGYVLLLISFPLEMTTWLPPQELAAHPVGVVETVGIIFSGQGSNTATIDMLKQGVDGYTMATPLDHIKTQLAQGYRLPEAETAPIIKGLSGVGWQWVNLGFLVGGLVLMFKKVIGWQIPIGVLLGMGLISLPLFFANSDEYLFPMFHGFAGATMLGAFFIATDPVTASTTPKGRWIFGLGIGAITVLIRTFGGYPDAIAFAVLLMNMAVPMIDYYTKPRTYGHARNAKESS
ncbi:electron transport complex subunit RsxD [Kangiella sediminilitoris]|uniref:Ion-translocating oxidoreductase complex subunit D n=1 Tax=Kangiella sediminilitoris TaxID=1144748 RepID=A0A1B3BBI8_9GAMM|nr:electron transport complex subunit RsxD [Kangiella sediminilitoris]AOE50137.1 electron transporter RnfG [Kangiella sediminilitoris]